MLNRNAARHLLLVASILLCAFIYAGYSLATRGDAEPAEDAAATTENGAAGLRPPGSGDDAARLIPPADGEELSLTPPVAQSMRPPPPAAVVDDSESIGGLVPDDSGGADDSGLMPGTSLPLPGFSSGLEDIPEDNASAPPVLTLPGMTGTADAGDEDSGNFGDEDFGEEDGDFAALPGFDAPAVPASAPVLPPPPGAVPSADAAPRATTLAPPPAVVSSEPLRAPAAETGTVLRPPPRNIPPAGALADTAPAVVPPARTAPPPAAIMRPVVSTPPPPPGTNPPDGMADEEEELEPRSDSLRIYVVSPGDTLSSIAMRELGSGFLADNIFLLNRDVIDDPNHLMAGVKIRLPYANPAAAGADPAVPGAPGRRPTQGLGGTHRVVRGDTLSSIAQQYYGQSAAWILLHEANKAIIPNPNQLTVGMELSIPPYGG